MILDTFCRNVWPQPLATVCVIKNIFLIEPIKKQESGINQVFEVHTSEETISLVRWGNQTNAGQQLPTKIKNLLRSI